MAPLRSPYFVALTGCPLPEVVLPVAGHAENSDNVFDITAG
jgi:hypothetical protein